MTRETRTAKSRPRHLKVNSPELSLDAYYRRKRKYFGDLIRAENLATSILHGCIEGSEAQGRPTRRWTEDVVVAQLAK